MFFGEDLDLDACEALLHTRWTVKDRKMEPKLFAFKWWDERVYHPVQSTYRMGGIFTHETRRIIRAHIDNTPPVNGRDWEPIKAGDILMPPSDTKRHAYWQRKITSLIRARQAADHAGIPYEVYVRLGLKHWYFGRNYIFEHITLPEPGMLNGAECYNAIIAGWMDIVAGSIQFAKSDRYKISKGVKHADIAEHQVWLLDQMSRKAEPRYAIKKFIDMDLLSREAAIARFGPSRVPA